MSPQLPPRGPPGNFPSITDEIPDGIEELFPPAGPDPTFPQPAPTFTQVKYIRALDVKGFVNLIMKFFLPLFITKTNS